ncbi:MAG: Crp/Fnr family transcriptional regulator [Reyranella sp.]|nr:Crp/Fnr family transcriptional regulator [Reyranella sp.]
MTGVVRKISSARWDSPIVARLRQFIDLGAAEVDTLRALIECELSVERRRDLVVDGYEYSKLSFIKEGFAARYKLLRNGRRQIINVMVPGDIIGLPGSFLDQATFSVIALTDIKLEVCSLEGFVAVCHRQPRFGLMLTWLAVQEAMSYADRVVDIGRRTPVERLAHFLLEIHGRLVLVGASTETSFDLPISQEVISDALGLSVPHLNRMFAKLRTEGLITITDRRIQFIGKKALCLLAHFQPARVARIPTVQPLKHELIA